MVLLRWFQSDPGWKRSRNRYQRISALLSHGRFCTQSGLFEFLMWLLRLVSYYICQYYFIDDHLSECTVRRQQTWGNPGSWGSGGFEMGRLCDKPIRKRKGLHRLVRCGKDAGGELPALKVAQESRQPQGGPRLLQLAGRERKKKRKTQQRWPEVVLPFQATLPQTALVHQLISWHYHQTLQYYRINELIFIESWIRLHVMVLMIDFTTQGVLNNLPDLVFSDSDGKYRLVSYYIRKYNFIDDHLSEYTVRGQQTRGNPGSWGCGGYEMGRLCDKQIRKRKGLHRLIRCREDARGKLPALPATQGHLQQPVGPDILQLPGRKKKGKAQQRWPEIVPPCQSTLLKITSGKTVISFHYHLYSLSLLFYHQENIKIFRKSKE